MLAEKFPKAALLSPAATLADRVARPWTAEELFPRDPSARVTTTAETSDSEFARDVLELSREVEMHPAWQVGDVEWLLSHAARKRRYGPLHRSVMRDRKGALLGCYCYHGRAGGMGRVLQILARPNAFGEVVDALFYHAGQVGLAGLRGRNTAQLMKALLTRSCIFVNRASTVIQTSDRDLAAAIERGDALITGLAGESWTRLVGDEFG